MNFVRIIILQTERERGELEVMIIFTQGNPPETQFGKS